MKDDNEYYEHDCVLGRGSGETEAWEIRKSTVLERAEMARKSYKRWKENTNASLAVIKRKDSWSDLQRLEDKYQLFNYCPFCGKKIEWERYFPNEGSVDNDRQTDRNGQTAKRPAVQ